jgi:hypothetical protein
MDASADAFESLCHRFKGKIKPWLKMEKNAQLNRNIDIKLMDIYDTVTAKGLTLIFNIICSRFQSIVSSITFRDPEQTHFRRERK